MQILRRLSLAQQTAAHLREGLRRGRWQRTLPGVPRLAQELDVSRTTLLTALRQLEGEGLLRGRGLGRSRSILKPRAARHSLRVGILRYEGLSDEQSLATQVLFQVQHDLEAPGHEVFFAAKTQQQLQHDLRRIARLVGENPADAWIVVSGTRALLRWFSRQKTPSFALFGRMMGLEIAGAAVDKVPAFIAATRQLLALGHRRIVCIARRPRTKALPGKAERAFLEELTAHGVETGKHSYCLPGWEETPKGFDVLLESLFRLTPPTALIVDEIPLVFVVLQFLARRGIQVPGQVSLVATDYDPAFAWGHPPFAHMRWDGAPIVRRVTRWVAALRKGRWDRRTTVLPAEFVPGGTIGPAPGVKRMD